MSVARRLVSLVLVAALGAGALVGCRSAPTVAVYIDGKQYTNAYVEKLNGEIEDALAHLAPQARPQQVPYGALRQMIVSSLVVTTVGRRIAKERQLAIPEADAEVGVTQVFGLQPGDPLRELLGKSEVAKVLGDAHLTLGVLSGEVEVVEPAEAQQREIYDTIMESGQVRPQPFEEVQQLFSREAIGGALGLRELLTEAFQSSRVTVNPRYAPLAHRVPVEVGGVTTHVLAPIDPR